MEDYGKDDVEFGSLLGTLVKVENFLLEEGYVSSKKNQQYRLVPSNGRHNYVLIDIPKRILTFYYTSQDGREENRGFLEKIKKIIGEKKQRLEERATEIEVIEQNA